MMFARRRKFSGMSERIGRIFSRIPLTPNAWTLLSLILAILVFYFLVQQNFLVSAILLLLAGFVDLVDGAVARYAHRVTKLGAYLDTIVDRYVEAIVIFGLLFISMPVLFVPAYFWIFLYFLGAFMTTYAKASAKEKGVGEEIRGGILERAERLILLFVGILLAVFDVSYLLYVIILLALLSNVSALQRILRAFRVR